MSRGCARATLASGGTLRERQSLPVGRAQRDWSVPFALTLGRGALGPPGVGGCRPPPGQGAPQVGNRVEVPPVGVLARLRRTPPLLNWRSGALTISLGTSICTCPLSRGASTLWGAGWLFPPSVVSPSAREFLPAWRFSSFPPPTPPQSGLVGARALGLGRRSRSPASVVGRRCGVVSPRLSYRGCVSPVLSSGSGSVSSSPPSFVAGGGCLPLSCCRVW